MLHRPANCKNRLFGGTTRIATEKRQTKPGRKHGLFPFLAKHIRYDSHRSLSHLSPSVSYKRVCKDSINLRGRKLRARPSYISVLFDDTFLKFYTSFADNVSQQKSAMSIEGQMRVVPRSLQRGGFGRFILDSRQGSCLYRRSSAPRQPCRKHQSHHGPLRCECLPTIVAAWL